MMIQVDGYKLDARSLANGVAPNFVHSLDASHLQAVAYRSKGQGIRHLAVIHDSFGTHAANTGKLSRILRETFVEQYSGDVLGDFRSEEHTSELQSLMRISYAVFCLNKKNKQQTQDNH